MGWEGNQVAEQEECGEGEVFVSPPHHPTAAAAAGGWDCAISARRGVFDM